MVLCEYGTMRGPPVIIYENSYLAKDLQWPKAVGQFTTSLPSYIVHTYVGKKFGQTMFMKFGKFYFCFSSLLAQQPRAEVSNNATEKYKTKT